MSPTKEYAQKIFKILKEHYPNAKMILNWGNNWELLAAIILSAQCTDKKVNEVTEKLFPKYQKKRQELKEKYNQYRNVILNETNNPLTTKKEIFRSAQDDKLSSEYYTELVNFAEAPIEKLEQDIKSTGFYHNKAKSIQAAAKIVLEKFNGNLPKTMEEMLTIPGVGRKTANVFLGNAYGIYEGIAIDTHVTKQSQILGLTKNTNPDKIEQDLMKLFPKEQWFPLTYLLIEHGRNVRKRAQDRITCGEKDCIPCGAGFPSLQDHRPSRE